MDLTGCAVGCCADGNEPSFLFFKTDELLERFSDNLFLN